MSIKRISNYTLDDVVGAIKRMLSDGSNSPIVHQHALNIYDGNDPVSSVFNWVKLNVAYIPDEQNPMSGPDTIELIQSPVRMVTEYQEGKPLSGDCDDQALLVASLLRHLEISSKVAILDLEGAGFDHAVAVANVPGIGELFVDTTANYPVGWRENYVRRIDVA